MKADGLDIPRLGAAASPGQPALTRVCSIRADLGPAVEFATTRGTKRAMFPIIGREARYMPDLSEGSKVMVIGPLPKKC